MELKQRPELRKLLVPQLNQSLKILSLPLLELKELVQSELMSNPMLEEYLPKTKLAKEYRPLLSSQNGISQSEIDFRISLITKKLSLQDVLLRQLGMFTKNDEDFRIGYEIVGNIDDNGYLKANIEEISSSLNVDPSKVESVLKLIQQFEPAGVAAKTVSECLLIQLDLINQKDPLLREIVENHLEDVAKKDYTRIAKHLNQPLEKIEPLIKVILKLDPKPGRNYTSEETRHIIPDITIYDKEDEFEITINDEDIPTLNINKAYKQLLKNNSLNPQTKEFLTNKLKDALNLLRAISRRKFTLRRILEAIVEIQQEAIRNDLSFLKPLTLQELAKNLGIHESTVCRAVMNKYARLPYGIVALKEFFSSSIKDTNGQLHSSNEIKRLVKDLIEKEDRKHPLSDNDISRTLFQEKGLNISRRTVTKYRERLKILSSAYRRER